MRRLRTPTLFTAALFLLPVASAGAQALAPDTDAYRHSAAAFEAVERDDLARAESELRAAMALAPAHPQLLAQWAQLMQRQGRHADAIAALDRLVEDSPGSALLRLDRAFAHHAAQNHRLALDDFTAAQALGLDVDRQRTAALGATDAALALGDGQAALDALQPLQAQADYDTQARQGMALRLLKRPDEALAAWRIAEQGTDDPERKAAAIRTRAQILRDEGRDADGNAEILDGVRRYPDNRALMLDAAYLAIAAGDDRAAAERFGTGVAHPDAPAHALVDAAYVANRLGDSQQAAVYFRQSIDRFDAAPPDQRPFDTRQWFGMRRQVQEIERRFGYQVATFYRGSVFVPGVSADDVLQASVEAYWQPQGIGYRGGRILQAFVRAIRTLDAPGLEDASQTLFGAVGVRYKPFGAKSLVLTVERIIGIGDLVEDDWLLRAGYSYDYGMDLQPWNRSWTTVNGFVEAVRFVEGERTLIGSQARVGRSFAFGSEAWVVLPHLSLSADYDSNARHEWAGGAGPGIAVRRWFRGNTHWAPPSYVDLQLQYRFAVGSDDRAEGLAAQLVLHY